jgi:ferrochelatase
LLTNLIILPFRHRKSTAAYRKIWTAAGSPLLQHSLAIKAALAEKLGPAYSVELAMRYGEPNIPATLAKLAHCTSLTIIPLFPQYASASTGSALEKVLQTLAAHWNIPALHIQNAFYAHPGFIAANAEIIQHSLQDKKIDKLIFSYHGLPERHIDKSQCQAHCDRSGPCPGIGEKNAFCYRAQCYATSNLIAKALSLDEADYLVSFQSRLGRTPWIKPYTDLALPKLRAQGIKNIAIASPSFVADCLETLEEINLRLREQWQALGGETFIFVPCLNNNDTWIRALADLAKATTP